MATLHAHTVLLRRRRKLILSVGSGAQPTPVLAALLKNLEGLGFTVSPALFARLRTQSEAELVQIQTWVLAELQAMLGGHVDYTPMYPGFPVQVMAADSAELYVNAIMHYVGRTFGLRVLPEYEDEPRAPLADSLELSLIDLGEERELFEIARNLIGARTSTSSTDKMDVATLITTYLDHVEDMLPDEILHKENLSHVTGLLWNHPAADMLLCRYFKTATDVLRLAVSLSGGDVSLASATRFKSFSRRDRRLLLSLLDRVPAPLEDMRRRRERFLRLGERLHPGEYRKRFGRAADAFDLLRNNTPPETPSFDRRVEVRLRQADIPAALELLHQRPGAFARRLDHLLRLRPEHQDAVVNRFLNVADQVATPVLLQVMKHFEIRSRPPALRAFFPKGDVSSVMTLPDTRPSIPPETTKMVALACEKALLARFAERPPLGKVYLDPRLADYFVPFSQRSAQRALRTITRGSRLPLPEGDTVRFFLWWKEGDVAGEPTGTVDVDLSAVMYDGEWGYKEHVSYTNLRSAKYRAVHSGDITSAPDGACEFIDLDMPSVLKHGGRYVVMSVLSYTRQPFHMMPECFAGWMARQAPGSGERFEPRTVVDKIDLSANTHICIPVILDLATRQVIWTDLALRSHPRWSVNVESHQRGMLQIGQAITTLAKPDLYALLKLHVDARGTAVETPEDADLELSVAAQTPFELETIMHSYL